MNPEEDYDTLPPPASGLFLEVSFRRLLASCEEIAAGQSKGREDLREWQTSPVFHHYVETLQDQLADLEGCGRIDPELLAGYHHCTATLSSSLRRAKLPELCRLISSTASPTACTPPTTDAAPQGAAAAAVHAVRPKAPAAVPRAVVPPPGSSAALPPLKPIQMSTTATSRVAAQGRAQEALTDELVTLAAAMKSNTLAMESKVKERGQLLDGTEEALEKSAGDTKKAATRATAAHKRGRMNFCFTFLVLMIIGTGFAAMYVFIRITSLTGYKASKMRPAVVPAPTVPVPVPDLPSPTAGPADDVYDWDQHAEL